MTLRTDRDAIELMSEARDGMVVIPVERLDDDFFRLKTGVAGAFIQKFVTYGRRLVVVGDISAFLEESSALRDFVYEANRGDHVWFVENLEELERRLEK
ncbi:MAG: DUF4180 domain-containing protein [Bryobacteraceae bacterium]